ncbi:unnamed protein product [Dovyalis caffra]|uniref:Histone acetyltransferase n=1 Tax=Dovyalis caffra TaxID=77055 RepID=A0AAV1SNT0_9ROSI|nr:unnamed protein product [Dovyalis caffra]
MPRPGPRPYECVRRAWHSDRHKPIRGSLIQEIFRLVNEVHSSATKKNKEWQDKLPVVVLKAEEIMYSKANSEAEYMDLKTLWDRANDAINTIIRRDESMETGELLQPCIEAALNLGCTPRRASRSQRNCSPRFYLSPSAQESNTLSPGALHNAIQANHASNSHVLPSYSNLVKPTIMNSTPSGSESQDFAGQSNGTSNRFLFTTDNIPPSYGNQCLSLENYCIPSLCSVYPLYYGSCLEPHRGCGALPKTVPGTAEPVKVAVMQNFFPRNEDTPVKTSQADHKDSPLQPQEIGCDLSLRLGSLPAPVLSVKTKQLVDTKDGGHVCSQEDLQVDDWMPQMGKELSFFTRVNVVEPLVLHPSKLREHINIDVTMKKRKAAFDHHVEDQQFCWQPKLPCNQLTSRMKSAGL